MHFWIVDLLTYPFGVYSIWPFVLPSIVAFGLLLLLMRKIGGPMSAFVCGTSLLLWGSAQTARMDVEFALLLALSAYFLWREKGALPFSSGVATGMAFLVKGPMAPVITLALFAFESIRLRRKPSGRDVLAVLPMLLIPLLWLVPAIIIGGEPFWREIFFKQTVGRAVGAWVHRSPPWFYLVRAPLTLLPWFFLAVAAIVAAYRRNDDKAKFAVSWILAVLVPYSLLSSKLDVYMIAMLPAVALLIGCFVEVDDAWGRRANLLTLSLLALVGVAGLIVKPSQIKGEDGALVARLDVRMLFAVLLIASIIAAIVTLRGSLTASTIATGFVPVAALAYAAVVLVPLANEMASVRPLVRALEKQRVAPEAVALYVCPHLWVRDMNPALWQAHLVDADELRAHDPQLIVARRKDADAVSDVLSRYERVDELRMIGKSFDVYRK
jgi:4-amino-4-deoxy-L-arabinose transferase-like glycosyltransferase